ncbi:MAG TPA: PxKF domain-containing protein, partial [Bellilinea sp.]|nr:PxKF domain-containing protein [Bellilinea sp.]
GPYTDGTATLPGGQTVNADEPVYQSGGFSAPVDLGGVFNTAKAGQMIPLKWRLLDAADNPVTNLDPASVVLNVSAYACQAGIPTDQIETYTSGTTLLQNLGDGYYQLNWKTEKSYANTCKQTTLKMGTWSGDGFTALFKFNK